MTAKKPKIKKTCKRCHISFEVHEYRKNTANYCSKNCWRNRSPIQKCLNCKKPFKLTVDNKKYCCKQCVFEHRKGPTAPAWKGGITKYNNRLRAIAALKKWRKKVLERDNYQCQKCGAKNIVLHAHHIKPFSSYPDLRFSLENGMAVCVPCHEMIHQRKLH